MMYCPRCGQQVVEETNFCPRCGFYFGVLRELLASGGAPLEPQPAVLSREPTPRQKGTRFGAKIVFFSLVLVPVFFGLCFLVDGPGPLLVPVTTFMTGIFWMLYARLFREPDYFPEQQPNPARAIGARQPTMLPSPADSVGGAFPPRVNTSEITPPSVTEHTTNFLGQK